MAQYSKTEIFNGGGFDILGYLVLSSSLLRGLTVLCTEGRLPAALNSIHWMPEAPPAGTTQSVPGLGDGAKLLLKTSTSGREHGDRGMDARKNFL